MERAFVKKGLKDEKLTQAVGTVVKSEADFLKALIKNATVFVAGKNYLKDKKAGLFFSKKLLRYEWEKIGMFIIYSFTIKNTVVHFFIEKASCQRMKPLST